MTIDFSKLDPQKAQSAQRILDQLNEIDAAFANDTRTASALCKEKRGKIIKSIEGIIGTSLEKQIEISKLPNRVWLNTCFKVLSETADPFVPENKYDRLFLSIINNSRSADYDTIFKIIWQSVVKMKEQNIQNYNGFVEYFAKFPLWGTLDPDHRDYDTLKRRAAVLKQHSYDFMYLYRKFPDYLSKETLLAILLNWSITDTGLLKTVKSIFPDYYEPDIFPNNKDDIFVDIGAYTGDSILKYVDTYGTDYKKIYAYEITERSCEIMRGNLTNLHDVEIRHKGVAEKAGEMVMNSSVTDLSANRLSEKSSQNQGERVEVVTLDEDLPDGFTFLKMDIEGAEYNALRGAEKTIRRCRPKLAICVYHGYDDIWRIPALIESIDPNYEFYLRHNGGNLIPTEFVLLCRPK